MTPRAVGVILSGGRSERMGSPKALLADAQGRTFLRAGIESLRAAGIRQVVVVTGFRPTAVAREALRSGATPVHNRGFARGQWSSVRVGLRAALRAGAGRVVIGPVDLPGVSPETVEALLRCPSELSVPTCRHRRGHPTCLSADLARRLLADRASSNLRAALEVSGITAQEVPVNDPEILAELNTPDQVAQWLSAAEPPRLRRAAR